MKVRRRSAAVLLVLLAAACAPQKWIAVGQALGAAGAAMQGESSSAITPIGGSTIESQIVGESQGLNAGTTFTLRNGQVWQQTESFYWHRYWNSPRVWIMSEGGLYKLRMEGIDRTVTVRRIR